jgi:hypothetical protein
MMRTLAAAVLLFTLSACGAVGDASKSAAGKALPPAPPPPAMPDDAIVCPADVEQCPDGSYVSRNPANRCAFDPCPGESKQ